MVATPLICVGRLCSVVKVLPSKSSATMTIKDQKMKSATVLQHPCVAWHFGLSAQLHELDKWKRSDHWWSHLSIQWCLSFWSQGPAKVAIPQFTWNATLSSQVAVWSKDRASLHGHHWWPTLRSEHTADDCESWAEVKAISCSEKRREQSLWCWEAPSCCWQAACHNHPMHSHSVMKTLGPDGGNTTPKGRLEQWKRW